MHKQKLSFTLILLVVLVPTAPSLMAREKCEANNRYCAALMRQLDKSATDYSNFDITDRRELPGGYEAVLLYSRKDDNFGLFVADKKTAAYYMTLGTLKSRRGHDYSYKITGAGEDFIDIEGSGDTYGDQEIKSRYFFDLKAKKLKASQTYNDVGLDKVTRFGNELYFTGHTDVSSGIIFRLNPVSSENGKYGYEVISEIAGEKLDPISAIEEKNGELWFLSKNKSYILNKVSGFKILNHSRAHRAVVTQNEIRIPKDEVDDVWFIPVPQLESFQEYYPQKVSDGSLKGALVENLIGPWVLVGSKIWFGIKFYDGEGVTGLGGYGIFDPESVTAEVRYSQETARWSSSAIYVDNDRVCLGLYTQPEGSPYPGGLLCEYFKTKTKKLFKIPKIINAIQESDGKLLLATENGLYIAHYNKVIGGEFSKNEDGSYRMDFTETQAF